MLFAPHSNFLVRTETSCFDCLFLHNPTFGVLFGFEDFKIYGGGGGGLKIKYTGPSSFIVFMTSLQVSKQY